MNWPIFSVATLAAFSGGMAVGFWICRRWWRPRWEMHSAGEAVKSYKYERDQRELHDSGRLRPPRADAGPPARLSRARPRIRR
jgi:hypothetical protein